MYISEKYKTFPLMKTNSSCYKKYALKDETFIFSFNINKYLCNWTMFYDLYIYIVTNLFQIVNLIYYKVMSLVINMLIVVDIEC